MTRVSTPTIKVQPSTRDRVNAIAAATHVTADQVVRRALDYLEREERRSAMREQSRAALDDGADRSETAAVHAQMRDGHAW